MLPFVRVDAWWHSGLAAAFASALCFVAGGTFLFRGGAADVRLHGGGGCGHAGWRRSIPICCTCNPPP